MKLTRNSHWINHLNRQYQYAKQGKTHSISLHQITKGFFNAIEKQRYLPPETIEKIQFLATKKLDTYKSCWGCVKKIFSSFHNLCILGVFESSALLAKKRADSLLAELRKAEQPNPENPFAHPSFLEAMQGPFLKTETVAIKNEKKSCRVAKKVVEKVLVTEDLLPLPKELSFPREPVNQSVEIQVIQNPVSLTEKEKMMQDLQNLWMFKDINNTFINEIWEHVLGNADIAYCSKQNNRYSIVLKKPLKGKYNRAFNFEIKERLEFTFSENGKHKKIDFSIDGNSGMSGPLSTKLKSMDFFYESENDRESCKINFVIKGFFGGTYLENAYESTDLLKQVVWETA